MSCVFRVVERIFGDYIKNWFLICFLFFIFSQSDKDFSTVQLQDHSHTPWIVIVAKYLTKWFNEVCCKTVLLLLLVCLFWSSKLFLQCVTLKKGGGRKKNFWLKYEWMYEQWQTPGVQQSEHSKLSSRHFKDKNLFMFFKFRKVNNGLRVTKRKKPSKNWFGKVIHVPGVPHSCWQK